MQVHICNFFQVIKPRSINVYNYILYDQVFYEWRYIRLPGVGSCNSICGISDPVIVNDLGLVGVSSILSKVRLSVGEPPLTVARLCWVLVTTGRVYCGDSDPLRKTSLSVSLPSSFRSSLSSDAFSLSSLK